MTFQEVGGPCGSIQRTQLAVHTRRMRKRRASATCEAHTQTGIISHSRQEGSMVPDASKTWNVPTCKKADNVKQPHRIVRHTGLQKMAFRAQHHARNASRAHRPMRHTSTHEARASSGRPDRAERGKGARQQTTGRRASELKR